jgi:hypothetical protein
MSYSVSKKNYYINYTSFGNNRTQRSLIDFGIYEPSSDTTAEDLRSRNILEGPQIITPNNTQDFGTIAEQNVRENTAPLLSDRPDISLGIEQQNFGTMIEQNIQQGVSPVLQQTQSIDPFVREEGINSEVVDVLKNFVTRENTRRAASFAATATGRGRR